MEVTMSSRRGASYDQLMKHMRSSGVEIAGALQKRQLLLSGYFHGYKGYRYCKSPKKRIPYENFFQIQAVIDFDEEIKASVYRPVMQLETALKSIVSSIVVSESKSDSFSEIIEKLMHATYHKNQSDFIRSKYEVRDDIYSTLTRTYRTGNIVKHYYDKDTYVPIWAVFEVITLGQFGRFVELLDPYVKLKISAELHIPVSYNSDGKMLSSIIYLLKDFRNSIAHNGVVFDCRYRGNRGVDQTLCNWLHHTTSVPGIRFDSMIDDIILFMSIMKNLRFKKSLLYATSRRLCLIDNELQKIVGKELYFKIFSTDTQKKLIALDRYLHAK